MIAEAVGLARWHAPLLLLVLPLAAASIAIVMPSARLSWLAAAAATVAAAALAAELAARTLIAGAAVPLAREGVALTLDGVGAFAAALLTGASAIVAIAAGALLKEFASRTAPFAIALMLVMAAAWVGALLARDLVAMFLAVEAAWLSATALTALSAERDRGALNGAWRMLGAGGVASALLLLGVGLIHRALGVGDIEALSVAQVAAPGVGAVGVALVLLALALKAGVAPLHLWSPAAFGRAGGLAALALGVVGVTGALAVLVRVAAHAIQSPELGGGISAALAVLGAASVVIGSVQAVGASSLNRLAGYACAAQAGGVLLSVALGSPAGFEAALIQLLGLCASAMALLAGAAAGRAQELASLDGLSRRAPWASAAITAGALSLMGAPLTIGFLGRWRLVEAGVGAGWWWAAGAVIVASLAGIFYGGRLIERMYFRRATTVVAGDSDILRLMLAPALAVSIAAIAIGLSPSLLLAAAAAAAAAITGAAT